MEGKFTESTRHYITLLQENIKRMAANSAKCKTWLITLVTAIAAFHDEIAALWVLLITIVFFYFLDCYYLGLERRFIAIHKEFVKAVKEDNDKDVSDRLYTFDITAIRDKYATTKSALTSKSTLPFYLLLFVAIIVLSIYKS